MTNLDFPLACALRLPVARGTAASADQRTPDGTGTPENGSGAIGRMSERGGSNQQDAERQVAPAGRIIPSPRRQKAGVRGERHREGKRDQQPNGRPVPVGRILFAGFLWQEAREFRWPGGPMMRTLVGMAGTRMARVLRRGCAVGDPGGNCMHARPHRPLCRQRQQAERQDEEEGFRSGFHIPASKKG